MRRARITSLSCWRRFAARRPHLRVIVIGLKEDHDYIQQVIGAGAKGYLTHSAKESEIRLAIEIVQDGSAWAPRKVLARLLESSSAETHRQGGPEPKFTEREGQVLRLLVAGHPNREIASAAGDRCSYGEGACGEADA